MLRSTGREPTVRLRPRIGTAVSASLAGKASGPSLALAVLRGLQIHPESEGQPVREREVPNDQIRVEDLRIGHSLGSQRREMLLAQLGRRIVEPNGVVEQRPLATGERGGRDILADRPGKIFSARGLGQCGQTGRVMLDSVEAAVSQGNDDADDLSLDPRQGSGFAQNALVERQMLFKRVRNQSMNAQHMIESVARVR